MAAPQPNGTLVGNLAATGAGTIGSAGQQNYYTQEQLQSSGSGFAPGTAWYETPDGLGVIRGPDGTEAAFDVRDPQYQSAKTALNYKTGQPQIAQTAQNASTMVGGAVGGIAGDAVASMESNHPYAKMAVTPTSPQQAAAGVGPYDKSAQSSVGMMQNIAPVNLLPMERPRDVPVAPTGAELFGAHAIQTYEDPQATYAAYGQEARGLNEGSAGELDVIGAQNAEDDTAKRQAEEYQQKFLREAQGRLLQADDQLKSALARGIDPNRIYRNGTLGRTDTMIALMLGGMANPENNQNLGLLNRMIDRDVEAQKAELGFYGDRAQNMLSFYSQALGGEQAAENAVRMNMLDMQENRIKAAATRLTGADAQMRAQEMIAQLEQKRAALAIELQDNIHNASVQARDAELKRVQLSNQSREAQNRNRIRAAQLNQVKLQMGDKWNPAWEAMLASGNKEAEKLAWEQIGSGGGGAPTEDADWAGMKPNERHEAVRKFGEDFGPAIKRMSDAQRMKEILLAHPDTANRAHRWLAGGLGGLTALNDSEREFVQLMTGGKLSEQMDIKGTPSNKDQEIVDQTRLEWGDSAEATNRLVNRDVKNAKATVDNLRATHGAAVDRYIQNAERSGLRLPAGLSKSQPVPKTDPALKPM